MSQTQALVMDTSGDFKVWLLVWLGRLGENEKLEIRPLKTMISETGKVGMKPVTGFFASSDPDEITAFCAHWAPTTNVYFGVLGRSGSDGSKESVTSAHCLWADIDYKYLDGGEIEGMAMADAFPIAPTLTIASGHGLHLYWFLDSMAFDMARVEAACKGIALHLKGDASVADTARLMRVPASYNLKDPDDPVEVTVRSYSPYRAYSLDAFSVFEEMAQAQASVAAPLSTAGIEPNDPADRFQIEQYLSDYDVPIFQRRTLGTSTLFVMGRPCFWDEEHTVNQGMSRQSWIGVKDDGTLFYGCSHSHCGERTWADARLKISGADSLAKYTPKGTLSKLGVPTAGTKAVSPVRGEEELKNLIRPYLENSTGEFNLRDILAYYEIREVAEKDIVMKLLGIAERNGFITEAGRANNQYRLVDRSDHEMHLYDGVKKLPSPIWLPFGLHLIARIYSHNTILVAGEKDAGKSCFALNTAYGNRNMWPHERVNYVDSEQHEDELENRLDLFPASEGYLPAEWRKIRFLTKGGAHFEDRIRPNALNIIDYLQVGEDAWRVVADIERCFDRLDKGLLLIVMQKRSEKEFAVGGEGTLEKARLAINMRHETGRNVCQIKVAKSWTGMITNAEGNPCSPRGYECEYKIHMGAKLRQVSDWKPPVYQSPAPAGYSGRILGSAGVFQGRAKSIDGSESQPAGEEQNPPKQHLS